MSELEESSHIHDLDSIFKPLGGFGKFQIFNVFCLSAIILLCTFSELGFVMTTAELKHRCLISECELENTSFADDGNKPWLRSAIPTAADGELDSCNRYNNSFQQECSNTSFTNNQYECTQFVYETDEWTIHREDWGMHCDNQRYLLNLVGSLYNSGQVLGGLFAGYLQDRFGRRTALVSMTLVVVIIGAIKSFSVNYAMMVTMEVLEAAASIGLFNGPFVLALEIVEPSKRVLAGTLIATAYPAGEMLLGLVQYLTFDWRNTIRICYLPFLLSLSFYWLLPESVRWLLNQERYDDAVMVLRKVARWNGTQLPEQAVKNILVNEAVKVKQDIEDKGGDSSKSYKNLWKSKILRLRILANFTVRMCAIFVYFGLTLNSVSLSEDKFVNFVLTGLIEVPSNITVFFLMDRVGRKFSLWSLLLLCGVACLVDAYIPDDWATVKLVLYLVGKYGASGGAFVTDIYTAEMFPTFVRSTILSASLIIGKLTTIVAPQVPLLVDIYKPLPLLVFGCVAILGSLASMPFPETLNSNLPDSILEAENLGKPKKIETQS